MIKAIIFDADKTLYNINTEGAYSELYKYIASQVDDSITKIRNRHKELKDSVKKEMDPKKRSYEYPITILLSEYDKDTKDIIQEAMRIFWDRIIEDLEETPTSIITVLELKDKYTLAIASDEFRPVLDKKLERIFRSHIDSFSFIITPEDTGTMKPSKAYYEIALKKLKVHPNEAIVVGDSYLRDLAPAKSLGIKTVLLCHTKDSDKDGNPDYRIKKMIELKKIIEICEADARKKR